MYNFSSPDAPAPGGMSTQSKDDDDDFSDQEDRDTESDGSSVEFSD